MISYLTIPANLVYGTKINEERNNEEAVQDLWLSDWRKIIEQGHLYQYAIKLFNDPVDYEVDLLKLELPWPDRIIAG